MAIYHNFWYTKHFILIIFYQITKINFSKILHIILLVMVFISVQLTNTVFTNWFFLSESFTTWSGIYCRSVLRNNIFTENTYIIDTFIKLFNLNYASPNSFFHLNSGLDTQFFDLDTSSNFLKQTIYNHTYKYLFQVSIFDNSSLSVDIILLLVGTFILSSFLFKIKIIF